MESHGFHYYWALKCEQSTLRKSLLKQELSLHAHAHTPLCYHIYMLGRYAMLRIQWAGVGWLCEYLSSQRASGFSTQPWTATPKGV